MRGYQTMPAYYGMLEATAATLRADGWLAARGRPRHDGRTRLPAIIGAVLIPTDSANPPSPDALNAFCRERLAAHKSPRHYFVAAGYPLTPSGKIQKFRLQELIAAGDLVAVDWIPPATDDPSV